MGKSLQWQWHYHHHLQLHVQLQLQPEIVALLATVCGTLHCLYFFSCRSPRHTIRALTNARLMRRVQRIRYIVVHARVVGRHTTFNGIGDV